jgi:outer membrane protein assembly factor BamA
VTYHINSNEPYRIGHYTLEPDDPEINRIVHSLPPRRPALTAAFRSAPEGYAPLVREGGLFDRDALDAERQRITTLLRRRGYYAFNRDNLGYLADTAAGANTVDLEMLLLPFRRANPDGTLTDTVHRPYYINKVTILTDYNALADTANRFIHTGTVEGNGMTIRYGRNGKSIRPSVLRQATYIAPGQLFNERNVDQTYSAFSSFRSLKNVNIRFTESEADDTLRLDCAILTMPAELQTFRVDVEGTNSAGDLGFASALSYQHRNLFKGAEVFTARIRGAYESLSGNKGGGGDSYWEFGQEATILFPRFLFPFLSYDFRRSLRASTELQISYNKQSRPQYARSIASAAWNYIWQDRGNTLARHTFKLLDLDYVFLPRIDPSFQESLPPFLISYNYTDQFIMAAGYTYSFSNYTPQNRLRNTHSLRASFELAGNFLYTLSTLTHAARDANGRYKLFGINYSQFVKTDIDFSRGVAIDTRNRWAFHAGIGFAVPYANAKAMPFERRYFAGGANSVRGWSVRELGPGSMSLAGLSPAGSFAWQVGDVRFDLNVEYRTKLFWKFELAAYLDAGNIWTIRPYAEQPQGNFDFTRFYREIAFSYGLGLRLDFDYFLLRFDTGLKAYNPQESGSGRWAVTHPNFNSNFAWHFAVGYPF